MVGPSFSLWSEAILRSDFTIKVVVLIVGKHAFQNTNMLACIPCWDINHSKTYHGVWSASTALLCTSCKKQHTDTVTSLYVDLTTGTCGQDPMLPPPLFFNINLFSYYKQHFATFYPCRVSDMSVTLHG